MNFGRAAVLFLVVVAIVAAIFYFDSRRPHPTDLGKTVAIATATAPGAKSSRYTAARELAPGGQFINAAPFTLQSLTGKKIVLLDIWTYSCINCQRTIPYLNAWYDKYKDQGLEIIGVHTPEFDFEKKYENVVAAVQKFGIKYPVMQDNNYATWQAYRNQYWPRKFLIDIDGYIVYDHIGEGGYAETEQKIQELLDEKMARAALPGARSIPIGLVAPTGTDESKAQSPEIYFGAARNTRLTNGKAGLVGAQTFTRPEATRRNELYLAGAWNITPEYAEAAAGSAIIFKYSAEDVYFVASAPIAARLKVRRDGQPLAKDQAGADIFFENGQSYVTVQADRLYKLIKETDASEHILELQAETPGLKAYTFTFG